MCMILSDQPELFDDIIGSAHFEPQLTKKDQFYETACKGKPEQIININDRKLKLIQTDSNCIM